MDSAEAQQPEERFASITYVPELTEAIPSKCRYFKPEVKLATCPREKLSRMFSKLKHPIDKFDQSGVVNRIQCGMCDKTVQKLPGQTTRMRLQKGQEHGQANGIGIAYKTNGTQVWNFFQKFSFTPIELNSHISCVQFQSINNLIQFCICFNDS